MISKELLSEVLNIENERISRKVDKFCFPNTNTIAVQYYTTDGWQHINICELAHKCKEWAYDERDTILTSWKDRDCCYCEINDGSMSFSAETETKAIFQACDWILNNIGSH